MAALNQSLPTRSLNVLFAITQLPDLITWPGILLPNIMHWLVKVKVNLRRSVLTVTQQQKGSMTWRDMSGTNTILTTIISYFDFSFVFVFDFSFVFVFVFFSFWQPQQIFIVTCLKLLTISWYMNKKYGNRFTLRVFTFLWSYQILFRWTCIKKGLKRVLLTL